MYWLSESSLLNELNLCTITIRLSHNCSRLDIGWFFMLPLTIQFKASSFFVMILWSNHTTNDSILLSFDERYYHSTNDSSFYEWFIIHFWMKSITEMAKTSGRVITMAWRYSLTRMLVERSTCWANSHSCEIRETLPNLYRLLRVCH